MSFAREGRRASPARPAAPAPFAEGAAVEVQTDIDVYKPGKVLRAHAWDGDQLVDVLLDGDAEPVRDADRPRAGGQVRGAGGGLSRAPPRPRVVSRARKGGRGGGGPGIARDAQQRARAPLEHASIQAPIAGSSTWPRCLAVGVLQQLPLERGAGDVGLCSRARFFVMFAPSVPNPSNLLD